LVRNARGSGLCTAQKIKATLPPIFRPRACLRTKTAAPCLVAAAGQRKPRVTHKQKNTTKTIANLSLPTGTSVAFYPQNLQVQPLQADQTP
jgi:hypothetical protein